MPSSDNRQKILITGANGFIGRRVTKRLLSENVAISCMVRDKNSPLNLPPEVDIVQADLLKPETLISLFDSIDTAFYLVHSMAGGRKGFEERDRRAAENFRDAAEKAGVKRVIYLGGLGEAGDNLSEHLKSRLEVAEILSKGSFATTFFRAAIIIGAGGASFEMIRALTERLPLMITPAWVSTKCQPIAVDDVIEYLAQSLFLPETAGRSFDVGGPDILTYREMLEKFAEIEGRKLFILPLPVLTPKLSSYWVGLITPVKPSVSIPLIEGLKNEVICRENDIQKFIPIKLTSYLESVKRALAEDGVKLPN